MQMYEVYMIQNGYTVTNTPIILDIFNIQFMCKAIQIQHLPMPMHDIYIMYCAYMQYLQFLLYQQILQPHTTYGPSFKCIIYVFSVFYFFRIELYLSSEPEEKSLAGCFMPFYATVIPGSLLQSHGAVLFLSYTGN